jgi:hypothetical protein
VSVTSSKSNDDEQLVATAETTVVIAGAILNSLPEVVRLLQRIFLFNLRTILLPSQEGVAFCK